MRNPIIKGHYADPDIACFDGKYYIYPTTDGGNCWEGPNFQVFSSADLVEWKNEGIALHMADVAWCGGIHGWAPAIGYRNGKYYFYYSANKNIAVGIGERPEGPFTDIGRPLVASGAYPCQAIDPDIFEDDDGKQYLYWGNTYLHGVQLAEDMVHFVGNPVNITPSNFGEAPCVFKRKGIYYFTWSRDDTRSPNYHVCYGKSTSPLEQPEGCDVILSRANTTDSRIRGTGHHSILNIPNTDEWYICYHRFDIEQFGNTEDYSTEAGNHRELCIDRLYFDEAGNILPVLATE